METRQSHDLHIMTPLQSYSIRLDACQDPRVRDKQENEVSHDKYIDLDDLSISLRVSPCLNYRDSPSLAYQRLSELQSTRPPIQDPL